LSNPTEIRSIFANIEINMNIANAKARPADYDARFLEAMDRCEEGSISDKALTHAYVCGVRPNSVKQALEDVLKMQERRLQSAW